MSSVSSLMNQPQGLLFLQHPLQYSPQSTSLYIPIISDRTDREARGREADPKDGNLDRVAKWRKSLCSEPFEVGVWLGRSLSKTTSALAMVSMTVRRIHQLRVAGNSSNCPTTVQAYSPPNTNKNPSANIILNPLFNQINIDSGRELLNCISNLNFHEIQSIEYIWINIQNVTAQINPSYEFLGWWFFG
ncbi:hypothetical protein EUGRSUZ_B01935 [Eucalyptus grandis]|uniref:Uncharacterized protein n=2 Tax=Eucalyptus grandis TaxID=71139 RepID=A0ACC3LT41_EUCGR|nr:hypothetical protein EUGRSUZ_B01935 [Eucalyptus grandis]